MSGHNHPDGMTCNVCEDRKEVRAKLDEALNVIASEEYGYRVMTPSEFVEVMRRLLAYIDA